MVESLKEKELLLIKELVQARETIQNLVKSAARLNHFLSIGNELNDKRGLGYIDEVTAKC